MTESGLISDRDARDFLLNPRYEVIPIKGLGEQAMAIPDGATVTVTCSPRFGLERTVDRCELLSERKIRVIPHIAARMIEGPDHWNELNRSFDARNIKDLFVIGGDAESPAGPFPAAADFLTSIAGPNRRFASIGIGGYPEGHPLIPRSELTKALIRKQPMADHIVTQICFNPETIAAWLREIRGQGISLPVLIGIPGVIKVGKLIEISARIGVGDSLRYLKKNARMMMRFLSGGYRPDHLVEAIGQLAKDPALGITGLHIFTFNQVENTERWRQDWLAK